MNYYLIRAIILPTQLPASGYRGSSHQVLLFVAWFMGWPLKDKLDTYHGDGHSEECSLGAIIAGQGFSFYDYNNNSSNVVTKQAVLFARFQVELYKQIGLI